MYYYFTFQFSAIQKAILRHDRLWSIAGMSLMLSQLNEIKFREIVTSIDADALVLVAGGGKFTARFTDKDKARELRNKVIKAVSTRLPMLEFQASDVIAGESLKAIKTDDVSGLRPGIIHGLNEQRRCLRGYGVSFNPHLKLCHECSEYPAIYGLKIEKEKEKEKEEDKEVCSVCSDAHKAARIDIGELKEKEDDPLTTIERIYKLYINSYNISSIKVPLDFKDLFADYHTERGQRMAVWMSDLNNMGDRLRGWFTNEGEDEIPGIFKEITRVNIDIVASALVETFVPEQDNRKHLPFRLIVAGGDDLCIVMDERYILSLVLNLSCCLNEKINELDDTHPLSNKSGNRYCFGGSFVVTSIHTPFSKIHAVGEACMGKAKQETNRKANSVNWRIMAEAQESVTESLLRFERPIFVEDFDNQKDNPIAGRLSFKAYVELSRRYSISQSHVQQIISAMIEYKNDPREVENWLIKHATNEGDREFTQILCDSCFKNATDPFDCAKLATMLELMSINDKGRENR
ncbi:MAG: hypothetical protein HQL02_10570 [Nitrospirae bacterium]|nr:hypothetical protein [Nitrospirota bacterium]